MAQVIVDARQWQNMFDLRTGRKLEIENPTNRMVRDVLHRHPYPGDTSYRSNRWVSEVALDLIRIYQPRLVCLSYAQQYFTSRFSYLSPLEYEDLLDQVFREIEDFIEISGYTPVIVGTGDMTELVSDIDLSRTDGLCLSSAWSARYAGLSEPSERDLIQVRSHPGIERVVSREEWVDLFAGIPYERDRTPDYLLVARPGRAFRTVVTPIRRAVRIPGESSAVPVVTDLGTVDDIIGLKTLIEQNLEATDIALIVVEGVGLRNFPRPNQACSNGRGWFYYEPGETQYLTITTGSHQVFAYPAGFLDLYDDEEYPFSGFLREVPGHTLGGEFDGRSIAVGNRSMYTHMVYGADICVECFARNLYNQGSMAVIHREKEGWR